MSEPPTQQALYALSRTLPEINIPDADDTPEDWWAVTSLGGTAALRAAAALLEQAADFGDRDIAAHEARHMRYSGGYIADHLQNAVSGMAPTNPQLQAMQGALEKALRTVSETIGFYEGLGTIRANGRLWFQDGEYGEALDDAVAKFNEERTKRGLSR